MTTVDNMFDRSNGSLRYNVGDKVKVGKLVPRRFYKMMSGGSDLIIDVNSTMAELSGKLCTIARIDTDSYHKKSFYRIKEDGEEYKWADEMFEGPPCTQMFHGFF